MKSFRLTVILKLQGKLDYGDGTGYFVAETGRTCNAHEATIKICVFPQPKTRFQTSLNLCDLSREQNSIAATKIFH